MGSPAPCQSPRRAERKSRPRRKVPLACDPCRERKSRCDGKMPICAACERRSLPLEQCVYSSENARSERNAAYIQSLHARIRHLEGVCIAANIAPYSADSVLPADGISARDLSTGNDSAFIDNVIEPRRPDSSRKFGDDVRETLTPRAPRDFSMNDLSTPQSNVQNGINTQTPYMLESEPERRQSSSLFELTSNITAMGAISAPEVDERARSPDAEYYGSSSAVEFMRLARRSIRHKRTAELDRHASRPHPESHTSAIIREACTPSTRFVFEDTPLPPRALADHLLECFWDRVFCLYPFFHRPSFQDAYENLWVPHKQPHRKLTRSDIGLGSVWASDLQSPVFQSSLNAIFALGCHFADVSETQRQALSHTFFLRGKKHIGLDLLDIKSIGVVQSLLLTTLYLQSTPYSSRCWMSIGVACRVAQGLGLHQAVEGVTKDPLELEIRRCTWYGCVTMDMTVSMTHGRPCMTAHLLGVPLPGIPLEQTEENETYASIMTFYVANIKLHRILDEILSEVYDTWRGQPREAIKSDEVGKQCSLDVIIRLEEKLSSYETQLPSFLNWQSPAQLENENSWTQMLGRQRNVLHARYLYFCLLLYRPIFTQLCSGQLDESRSKTTGNSSISHRPSSLSNSLLYSSVTVKCAAECVNAALNLIMLIYNTYQTQVTDAWWYNGFYVSTAGLVVMMSLSCRAIVSEVGEHKIEEAWKRCNDILSYMTTFSSSACNTLNFLQALYAQSTSNHRRFMDTSTHQEPNRAYQTAPADTAQGTDQYENLAPISENVVSNSDIAMMDMNDLEDLGFLGTSDFLDFSRWFSDTVGMPECENTIPQ